MHTERSAAHWRGAPMGGFFVASILLACTCAADPPIPIGARAKFDSVYRAGKAIRAATEVGLNYSKFGELLQAFATEMSIARDRASTPQERALLERYSAAFVAYQECGLLWGKKIKTSDAFWQGSIVYKLLRTTSSKEPKTEGQLTPIVEKYQLPTKPYSHLGVEWVGIPADSFRVVMAAAGKLLDEATKAHYAEEPPGPVTSPGPAQG